MAELYRDLVRILQANGCRLARPGKGSHETINNKHVSVPRSIKSRHTANEVLKKVGLEKAF
jgi:predicted RNA binding protein YcfA (HicA-like mRNA interferase family)